MPDVLSPETAVSAETRRRMRLDRQARVGLLRNPNRPPPPRPRRAAIMGRWLNLRSSRRATDAVMPGDDLTISDDVIRKLRKTLPPMDADPPAPAPEPAPPGTAAPTWQPRHPQAHGRAKPAAKPPDQPTSRLEDTVALGPDGGVQSIDVAGLAAAVEDIGGDQPVRTPYASGYRADQQDGPEPPRAPRPVSIFSPEAWLDDDTDAAPDPDDPDRPARISLWGILRPVLIVLGGIAMAGFALLFLLLLGPVG